MPVAENSHPDAICDQLARPLHDLRISVTDRCNFRCSYCMPKDVFNRDHLFLRRDELLSFEEISRVARAFVALGVKKIRLTGGEPLIRSDLDTLIAALASIPGLDDLSLTSNASLITPARAKSLKAAGIQRVNISLDALDNPTFAAINSVDFPVENVLAGIDALLEADFDTIKINVVVQKGLNAHTILPMARHFRQGAYPGRVILRFIEFMDVGNSNNWRLENVLSAAEIRDQIHAEFPIEPMSANYSGEVASRWRYQDGKGEIGLISSISQPFCHDCSRARLSAVGEVFTCLFASEGTPLKPALRKGISDADLLEILRALWAKRTNRYSEIRSAQAGTTLASTQKVEMSYIGG